MADPATGGALTGAASGAAAGATVAGPYGAVVGGLLGAAGGYLSASGTAESQAAANKVAAQNAAAQSAQSWQNYLASRGINLQQLVAQFPDLQQTYQEALARGDKRDFNTWLYAALQAAPNHPIWDAIANPAGTAGAANTTLPAWAVDANGNPLQPSTLQDIVSISNQGKAQQRSATAAAWLAGDGANLQNVWDAATDQDRAAYGSLENFVLADYDANATPEQRVAVTETAAATAPPGSQVAPPGPAGAGNNLTLDPAISNLIPQATNTVGQLFDSSLYREALAGLVPVQAARDAEAAALAAKINEQRAASGTLLDTETAGISDVLAARTAGAGDIYDATMAGAGGVRAASEAAARAVNEANVTKLAELLGVRREAAQAIYDASAQGAAGVRDARTTGAQGIYGAESLKADTYAQSAEQALSRALAEQSAERARRGFTGGSSGSDIIRARLMSGALQEGAGARAQAGVNLQNRLSDAGVGYAGDIRTAGVGRATTLGQSAEADAQAKLVAAVDLAKSLGLAGTNYATAAGQAGVGRATTVAGAGEQNAIALLQAKVADATRRLGYLTSDADIAKAQADLKNAQDALGLLVADQNRKVSAIGAPFSLAGMDLSLKSNLSDQQYTDIDAFLKRLNSFTTTPASGPTLTTPAVTPVANNNQIIGGAITGLNNSLSTDDWIKVYNSIVGTPATTTPSNSATGSILGSPNFLANASVFAAPKPTGG